MSAPVTRAPRRWRATLVALIAVVQLLTFASVTSAPSRAGASVLDPATHDYARVHVSATADSAWAVATFDGLEIIDHVHVSGPPVAVTETSFSWFAGTAEPTTIALDLLVAAPIGAEISVTTTKGSVGTFTVAIGPWETQAAAATTGEVVNSQVGVTNNNSLTTPLSREAVLADRVEVGPIDSERLVLTVVHPWWYGNEWGAITPDQPLGPWTSTEPWQVDAAIDQMAFTGTDVALYSYGWPGYDSDPRIDNLLNAVRSDGRLRVAPMIELMAARDHSGGVGIVNYVVGVVASAMADAAANPGLFLERDGRPVVFFYADWILDTNRWNELVGAINASGHNVFPITHVEDANRQSEGYWEYLGPRGLSESQYTNHASNRTLRGRLQPLLRPDSEPRLVVGSVWPGYDDSSQPRAQHRYEARAGGEFYNSRWRAALEGQPDWVVVTSWNEWWEQTHIAPSTQGMTLALWQTLGWSREFDQR